MNNIVILIIIAILVLVAYLYYSKEKLDFEPGDLPDESARGGYMERGTIRGGQRADTTMGGMFALGVA